MAKMWKRASLRDNDDDDDDDDDVEEKGTAERYRRPYIAARQYDPSIIESLPGYDDDDGEDSAAVDGLLKKIRAGKYKPKKRDHWSLHVAYNLIQSRD